MSNVVEGMFEIHVTLSMDGTIEIAQGRIDSDEEDKIYIPEAYKDYLISAIRTVMVDD